MRKSKINKKLYFNNNPQLLRAHLLLIQAQDNSNRIT